MPLEVKPTPNLTVERCDAQRHVDLQVRYYSSEDGVETNTAHGHCTEKEGFCNENAAV